MPVKDSAERGLIFSQHYDEWKMVGQSFFFFFFFLNWKKVQGFFSYGKHAIIFMPKQEG